MEEAVAPGVLSDEQLAMVSVSTNWNQYPGDPETQLGAYIGDGPLERRYGGTVQFYFPGGHEAIVRIVSYPSQPLLSQSLDVFVATNPTADQIEVGRLGGDGPAGKTPSQWFSVGGPQAVRAFNRFTMLTWWHGNYRVSNAWQTITRKYHQNGVLFEFDVDDAGSFHRGEGPNGRFGDMRWRLVVMRRAAATWPGDSIGPL